MTTADAQHVKELEREKKVLRRSNEILKLASAFLPRRSFTAGSSDAGLHRQAPRFPRGRTDLQGAADRFDPVGLSAACRDFCAILNDAAPASNVAFVIDIFARRTVGWRVSTSMRMDSVIDALEQALYARQPARDALICHSDRGSQYVSIRYADRLAEAGIEPSACSKGDSYKNALAETINGLYKAELIHRRDHRRPGSPKSWPRWNGRPGLTTIE